VHRLVGFSIHKVQGTNLRLDLRNAEYCHFAAGVMAVSKFPVFDLNGFNFEVRPFGRPFVFFGMRFLLPVGDRKLRTVDVYSQRQKANGNRLCRHLNQRGGLFAHSESRVRGVCAKGK
jgi:hypothetical protein